MLAAQSGCYLTHERDVDAGPRADDAIDVRPRCLALENPSFDDPPSAIDLSGASTLRGWRVSGDVDVLVSGGVFGVGVEGANFIDLNGVSPGTLSQELSSLEIGATYRVEFSLTANNGAHRFAIFVIDDAGPGAMTSYRGEGPSTPIPASAWRTETFSFVARSERAEILLRSLSENPTQGVMLDAFRCPEGVEP